MKILLDKSIVISPEDNKTNIILEFDLEQNFEALIFHCNYSPKVLDDRKKSEKLIKESLNRYIPVELMPDEVDWEQYLPLNNHVTLSLDYDNKYVGCAHRHAPEQTHRISENFASPGFFKIKTAIGKWRAVLNVHCIITKSITYNLKVTGVEEGDADIDRI